MWTNLMLHAILAAASPAQHPDLHWLAGHWCSADGTVEEHWLPERGGLMLGVNRSVSGERTHFEFLRIEFSDSGAQYIAQPGGAPPTRFSLSAATDVRVEFSNPQHDFPKRVSYWRDGQTLHARVDAGQDETDGEDFTWQGCP